MFKKILFYFVLLSAILLTSNCGGGGGGGGLPTATLVPTSVPTLEPTPLPTNTPAPLPISTTLGLYDKDNGCETHPSDAKGEIEYQSWMQSGFMGTLKLSGLDANQSYIFTINGREGDPSNELLKQQCGTATDQIEGWCDFKFQSDEKGEASEQVTQALPPAQYRMKFLVKKDEQASNYCVFMYNEDQNLMFEVK